MTANFRTYRDRFLESSIRQALLDTRLVGLVGARQVGKSTLARHLTGGAGAYFTFDDLATRAAAAGDPAAFAAALPIGATVDEVQFVPEFLSAAKVLVDRNPTPGRLILTGSAQLLTLPKIAESLAGRIEIFALYPFSQAELEKSPGNFVDRLFADELNAKRVEMTLEDTIQRLLTGGYPEIQQREIASRRNAWFHSYVTTLLQRDVREVSAISDILGMERLLRLCAARSSSILNETALASEIALPRKTLSRYLDILEQTFLIWRLPAYAMERGRRVSKAPKIHLADVGLASYLYGADFHQLSNNRTMLGGLLETFAANEIRAQSSWSESAPRMYHYREYEGLEVDFVLEKPDGTLIGIEIKATSSPGNNDFQSLRRFSEISGAGFQRGVLLYGGAQPLAFGKNLIALPISTLWN